MLLPMANPATAAASPELKFPSCTSNNAPSDGTVSKV